MPHSDVLYVRVFITYVPHRSLKAAGEALMLSLELKPPLIGLTLTVLLNRLPVVVDNKIGDLDVVRGQLVEGIVKFLVG